MVPVVPYLTVYNPMDYAKGKWYKEDQSCLHKVLTFHESSGLQRGGIKIRNHEIKKREDEKWKQQVLNNLTIKQWAIST